MFQDLEEQKEWLRSRYVYKTYSLWLLSGININNICQVLDYNAVNVNQI